MRLMKKRGMILLKKLFRKGDIVETPFNAKAEVNWVDYDKGKIGVQITEYGNPDDSGVYNTVECTLVKRALHVPRTEKPIHKMSVEDLKAELEGHRYGQKQAISAGHKKKSTKRSTRSKTKPKKKSKLDALAGILSPEEIQKLKEKALEKKGG